MRKTHWAYWVVGALLTIITIGYSPLEIEQYALLGIVALLFHWGIILSEKIRN